MKLDLKDKKSVFSFLEAVGGTYAYSTNHREKLKNDDICGCFYCIKIFSPTEIVEWCDEKENGEGVTAICPFCGIDAIICASTGLPLTLELLQIFSLYDFRDLEALSASSTNFWDNETDDEAWVK
jgi:hypothetical protein